MNSINKYITGFVLSALMLFSTSCSEFLDVNEDPNNPVVVSEPLLLTGIIANFTYQILAGYPVRVTSTWVQQQSYNGALPHYGIYRVDENDVNNTWTYYSYSNAMQNCKILSEIATTNELYDYAGIAKIIWAWNMSIVTDLYGNAPFSEAWNPDMYPRPAYDTQESIYASLQTMLDDAIADIDRTDGLSTYVVGEDDFVYGGNMTKWKKLAYLLKARFYMRLSYAPGFNAVTQADLALAATANSFASNTDNATYEYLDEAGQENPWYQYAIDGKWSTDQQMSDKFISDLLIRNDPRIYALAGFDGDGEFSGHENGVDGDTDKSPIGEYYSAADAAVIMASYPEVKFIEAEAHLIKGDLPAAQTAYSAAVRASFDELSDEIDKKSADDDNLSGASTDVDAYLTANETLRSPLNIAYNQVMNQKYIAMFTQFEVYNDWRRTKIPSLSAAQNANISSMTEPATRFPYPSAELNYNSENVNAQGVPVGFNAVTSKVWWNTAPENCTLCNN
ncbi:SusD/RagB family nutrient-binding outer membrane lipoprotein [Reichenbachiella sp. MALMAid0571]|uniref:SusD/RagB family nutrient-binding outer membrane lipoprotein n=1 Tax=Reichenbachiella sp. MALMAid0571 TaxID=3143939 RepID=UPI0032DFB8D6